MGKSQSKEEIVIAQAGNSGGQTTSQGVSLWEVVILLSVAIFVLIIIAYCYQQIKKNLTRKIRREIIRSQELV